MHSLSAKISVTNTKEVLYIKRKGLHIVVDGTPQVLAVDNVIVCAGQEPRRDLYDALKTAGDFAFTEGATCDAKGDVFFVDQPNDRIMEWSADGKLSTFLQPSGYANGMSFDAAGILLACAAALTTPWSTPDAPGIRRNCLRRR